MGKRKSKRRSRSSGWGSDHDVMKAGELDPDGLEDVLDNNDSAYIQSISVEPIFITHDVHRKFVDIMHRVPSYEWGAMLDVDEDTDLVEDIFIPEQEGKRATVDIVDHESCQGYNGFIHSHHSMGLAFSNCDDEGVNSNYDYSLTICWKDQSKGTVDYYGSRRVHITDERIVTAECDVEVFQPQLEAGDRMEEAWSKKKYKSKKKSNSKSSKKKSKGVEGLPSSFHGRSDSGAYAPNGSKIIAKNAGEVIDAVLAGDIAIETWILRSAKNESELLTLIDEHVLLGDGTVLASAGVSNNSRLLEDFKDARS